MTRPMGLDHNIAEPRGHLTRQKDITADRQGAERILAAVVRRGVLFVGPFDKAIVDIVPADHARRVLCRKDQPGRADAVLDRIPLKEVVPRDDIILPRQQRKMAKAGGTVVADLNVIGVAVDRDRGPVRHVQGILGGQELATVHEHPLTAPPDRRDTAILRARDKAVPHMENRP